MATMQHMATTRVQLRGDAVRDLVNRDGLTQEQFARSAGMSRSYLHRLLEGERRCSWDQLIRLATALRVQPTTIAEITAESAAEVSA